MYSFSLSEKQAAQLSVWTAKQNAQAVAAQKQNPPDVPRAILESSWEDGYPYGGAIGGSLTFSFTPTSLGVAVKVTDAHTGEAIDLSDYEDW